MSNDNILFIGLDTHKTFTEIAYSFPERSQPIEDYGRILTLKTGFLKWCKQMQSKYPGTRLYFVYEAGPCGYWVYRYLTSLGHQCYIVAPSLIPKKPGNQVKTDKRDARMLCQLLKTGDISSIYVPESEDEAIRDLSRARETAMNDLNDTRHQLKALLLRNNIQYNGKANWSKEHLHWLTSKVLPHPAQQIVLQEMLQSIRERMDRLSRLENELFHHVQQWRYYPVVKAIQAMRGVSQIVAVGIIAELGDLTRFDHPRKLMSYLGLVPREHSSGSRRHQGGITHCGNSRARRLLIEGAHCYRYSANISPRIEERQEDLSSKITDIAWQAQLRLCRRYQRLIKRGKNYNVVITAIAREMTGFIWAIAKEVVLSPVDLKTRLIRVPR